MDRQTVEDRAVADYLTYLRDGDWAFVDHQGIDGLTAELAEEDDVLRRLELQQQIIDAQDVDVEALEQDFITYAQIWAHRKSVKPEVFIESGVPRTVLRRAGIVKGNTSVNPRVREYVSNAREWDWPMSAGDVAKRLDLPKTTASRSLRSLEEAGVLVESEPIRSGVGRPKKTYTKAVG